MVFSGFTPLYAAVRKNATSMVQYLLQYNASVNAQSKGENSSFYIDFKSIELHLAKKLAFVRCTALLQYIYEPLTG